MLAALALAGPGPAAAAALVKIGALTDSWGPNPQIFGLRDGLTALGYRENEHFVIAVRFTGGNLAALANGARELVQQGADVLFPSGGDALAAAHAATTTLPIVFAGSRVLAPYAAADRYTVLEAEAYRDAARRLGVALLERPVNSQQEAQAALAGVRKPDVQGIIVPHSVAWNLPGFALEVAAKQGIPTMFPASFFVDEGGLASYGPDYYATGARRSHRSVS